MLAFVNLGLTEFAVALGVVTGLAALAGAAYYTFRSQRAKVKGDAAKEKSDVVQEWRDVVDVYDVKIKFLEQGLAECRGEHATCERKVNRIIAFNLRHQARERHYQRLINELQVQAGLPVTDFNDV